MLHRIALCSVLIFSAQSVMALNFGRMQPNEVSVYVQNLTTGKVIESHRADAAMKPASTMKLVTTFAALRALGPDYRWVTPWQSPAAVVSGSLEGDIYWVGSGNPVLDQNDLLDMQAQLRERGINKIKGQLVLDRSRWNNQGSAHGFDGDSEEAFSTEPDPHMLAYKVVWAKPERNILGDVVVNTNPPLPGIEQSNTLSIRNSSRAACTSLKNFMNAQYQNGSLMFSGSLPESCLGQEMFINMLEMQDFASKSFINHWRDKGGEIQNGYKVGKLPERSVTLAINRSKPLAEVMADMNKNSNNVIARSVFLTLGEHFSNNQTQYNATAEVRRQLVEAGLDDEALVLENGSGLSRRERMSARMMGEMLKKTYQSPFKQAFIDSLPIAGTDGTLKSRFKQVGTALRLKTGTLKNVRALAGYWLPENKQQHPLALVVLVNSERSGMYLPDLDKLVVGILQDAELQ